ncbi:MAG: hypothetical protein K2J49_01690 [Muribaculaceae bacterium]|nr:hypothetical protein [Muribaculaceae bacterium]
MKKVHIEITYLLHLKGDEVSREIILGNGSGIKLSRTKTYDVVLRIYDMIFGEINWKPEDFISEEEFENV